METLRSNAPVPKTAFRDRVQQRCVHNFARFALNCDWIIRVLSRELNRNRRLGPPPGRWGLRPIVQIQNIIVCSYVYPFILTKSNSLPFVEFLPWHESGTLISHFRHRFWNQRPGAFFPLFSSANYNWQQLVKHLTNVWFLRRTRIPTSENQQQVRVRDPRGCANQR